jgi:hypothetical protein
MRRNGVPAAGRTQVLGQGRRVAALPPLREEAVVIGPVADLN